MLVSLTDSFSHRSGNTEDENRPPFGGLSVVNMGVYFVRARILKRRRILPIVSSRSMALS